MFNPKTLYALNKKDPDAIVYTDANGKTHRLTRANFDSPEEFDRWKRWSDQNLHAEDNRDQVYFHHTRSMNEVADTLMPDPEALMEQRIDMKERERISAEMLTRVKDLLTEKQLRRLWMYYVEDLDVKTIAQKEGTVHSSVSESIQRAKKKILKSITKNPTD